MDRGQLPVLPLLLGEVPSPLRTWLKQEGIAYRDHTAPEALARFVLFDSRKTPPPQLAQGQVALDVDRLRTAARTDPFEQWQKTDVTRGWWKFGPLSVSEEISEVDRRAVRQRALHTLRAMVEEAGGIWFRLSAFPYPYRGMFNFRVDYDEYDVNDFRSTLDSLSAHQAACSHFICGSSYEAHPEALAELRGCDVGAHGYHHHTYADYESNVRNIRRSVEVLQAAGIEPSGFVAPHGRSSPGLMRALEEIGISHSSEFALAYDELPFWPGSSRVLQLPVHPVCLGVFLEAASQRKGIDAIRPHQAADLAATYFARVARTKYLAGEPVLLYGHPTRRLGRYPQVLKAVMDEVSGFSAIWSATLTEMTRWWRARDQVEMRVWVEAGNVVVQSDRRPARYGLAGELLRGEHAAVVQLDARIVRFDTGALIFERRSAGEVPRPIRLDPAESVRNKFRRYVDWERVTPLEEIDASSWRGWVKRAIRWSRR